MGPVCQIDWQYPRLRRSIWMIRASWEHGSMTAWQPPSAKTATTSMAWNPLPATYSTLRHRHRVLHLSTVDHEVVSNNLQGHAVTRLLRTINNLPLCSYLRSPRSYPSLLSSTLVSFSFIHSFLPSFIAGWISRFVPKSGLSLLFPVSYSFCKSISLDAILVVFAVRNRY